MRKFIRFCIFLVVASCGRHPGIGSASDPLQPCGLQPAVAPLHFCGLQPENTSLDPRGLQPEERNRGFAMPTFFDALGGALRGNTERAQQYPRVDERPQRRRAGWMSHMVTLAIAAAASGNVDMTSANLLGGGLQPAPDFAPKAKKFRRSYQKEDLRNLARDAMEFKAKAPKNERTWQLQFLIAKHGALDPRSFEEKRYELRAALKAVGANCSVPQAELKGTRKPPGVRNKTGQPRRVTLRCRKHNWHDRKGAAAELEQELWHWFADRTCNNKTRVTAAEIKNQAQMYKDAILEDWKTRCDRGEADPRKKPELPDVQSGSFLRRWRYRYNVTPRTVNLRYKIPRATFLSRLKVFWSNCIIVRRLYEALYPGHELDFLGFDQKPLWFNSIMSERTYAFKGSTKVAVAENVSASRARFTAMTQCKTWLDQAVGGLQPDPEDAEVIWDTSAPLVMGGSQGDDGLQPGDLFDGAATDPSDLQPEDLFDEGATGPSGLQP